MLVSTDTGEVVDSDPASRRGGGGRCAGVGERLRLLCVLERRQGIRGDRPARPGRRATTAIAPRDRRAVRRRGRAAGPRRRRRDREPRRGERDVAPSTRGPANVRAIPLPEGASRTPGTSTRRLATGGRFASVLHADHATPGWRYLQPTSSATATTRRLTRSPPSSTPESLVEPELGEVDELRRRADPAVHLPPPLRRVRGRRWSSKCTAARRPRRCACSTPRSRRWSRPATRWSCPTSAARPATASAMRRSTTRSSGSTRSATCGRPRRARRARVRRDRRGAVGRLLWRLHGPRRPRLPARAVGRRR